MTVSVAKTKFAADTGCFEVNHMADNEDAKKIEADLWVMTKQRNLNMWDCQLCLRTPAQRQPWQHVRWPYLQESTCFDSVEDLWRLHQLLGPARKSKQDREDVGSLQMLKKIAMGVYWPRKKSLVAALLRVQECCTWITH